MDVYCVVNQKMKFSEIDLIDWLVGRLEGSCGLPGVVAPRRSPPIGPVVAEYPRVGPLLSAERRLDWPRECKYLRR